MDANAIRAQKQFKRANTRRMRDCADLGRTEPFLVQNDNVGLQYDWWEICCFPYLLCVRVWDCCLSVFSGSNQCLVYWMLCQWVSSKVNRCCSPDPIIFPYYFYIFCQVIILSTIFILIWVYFGKTIFMPYFKTFYSELIYDKETTTPVSQIENSIDGDRTKRFLRRYCFRKSEIFDTPVETSSSNFYDFSPLNILIFFIHLYVSKLWF